jgi:anti-anti-sigma regulatory factor
VTNSLHHECGLLPVEGLDNNLCRCRRVPVVATRKGLLLTTATVADRCVLTGYGVLDATTYFRLREAVIKAAHNGPRAVIIDVTRLTVAKTPALSLFIEQSDISHWPEVPMALVCASRKVQKALRGNAISRQMPVYWSVEAAIAALPR